MNDYERAAKLREIERKNFDAIRACVFNGRKVSEIISLQLGAEITSQLVIIAHRARMVGLPKKLQRRVERTWKMLMKLNMEFGDELSRAITVRR